MSDSVNISESFLIGYQAGINLTDSIEVKDRILKLVQDKRVDDSVAEDFKNVLNDILNEAMFLIKTDETADPSGETESYEPFFIPINGRIMPLSDKDRKNLDQGTITEGNRILYSCPSYDHEGESYRVNEGDVVKDINNIKYRVAKIIEDQHLGSTGIYRKALLKIYENED